MCGTKFHMLPNLLSVIKTKTPVLQNLSKISNKTYVFMFAKQSCKFSKHANSILKNDLNVNPENICIVDKESRQFLCAKTWKLIDKAPIASDENATLQQVLGIWDLNYKNATVPQIFIHFHPTWFYVGGCMDLQKLSTVENIQGDDLLHLLPLGKEAKYTEPTQLKF